MVSIDTDALTLTGMDGFGPFTKHGRVTLDDGTTQATYKGFPLYYWVNDRKRGDTTGQDVGKVWYVIDPAKFPPAGRM